jgi:hypothetical protein
MVNAMKLHKVQSSSGWKKLPRMGKAAANILVGRAGMALTHREVEAKASPAGRGWYDEKRESPA